MSPTPDTLLPPPAVTADDDVQQVIARRLTFVLAIGLLTLSAVAGPVAFFLDRAHPTRGLIAVLAFVLSALVLWLLRRGRPRLAALLLLWTTLAIVASAGLLNGGLDAPAFIPTITLAAFAALALGLRQAIFYCVACALLCTLMAVFAPELRLPQAAPVVFRAIMYALMCPITAVFLWSTANLLRAATRQAREESARRTAAEARLRTIINCAPEAVVTLDPAGRVEAWNPRAEMIFGWTEAEIRGRELAVEIADLDEAGRPREATRARLRPGPALELDRTVELPLRRRDQQVFPAELTVVALPQGGAERYGVFVRDISASRRAQDEIRQLNAELDQRVRERTAELALRVAEVERLNAEQLALMRDLRSSQQAADRAATRLQELNASLVVANAELEAFSYSVSHDLRAPLRNIAGFADLLARRAGPQLDTEAGRYLGTITRETRRLGTLIDSLLKFSQLGRAALALEPVDLDPIVAAVRDELAPQAAGREIEWRCQALPRVRADRALVRQVLANLLANSVKFTRHRAPAVIEVGTAPGSEAGRAVLYVRDNGAGFNPRYADKLFGVFARLHSVNEFEGTGIGLANVKRIVARHGGRVWAEGSPDQGATFFFTLPTA